MNEKETGKGDEDKNNDLIEISIIAEIRKDSGSERVNVVDKKERLRSKDISKYGPSDRWGRKRKGYVGGEWVGDSKIREMRRKNL